ncbi:MAG: amidase [Henriciella sp.]|uniref:amidase n=1 Tax=Henriciella sp. TaxID=1968823 RepID=UPI003C76D8F3
MTRITRRTMLRGSASLAALLPFAGACAPAQVLSAVGLPSETLDGVRMAELISSGEFTSLDFTDAAIARAEKYNPKINAIATPMFDEARARAATSPTGAFGGVPTFLMDLSQWKGAPTIFGSRAFKDFVSERDSDFVAQWRKNGVVALGKSTTPEAGLISSTEPLLTGATRNPWDLNRIPGGSSGGSAALVAARVVPFAQASDGGGSIRIPAACCGLFGLKPSRGALIQEHTDEGVDLSIKHAVTLTVRDSAALFAAGEDADGGLAPTGMVTGPSTRRLRIAFAPDPNNGAALDAETRAGLERTADLCRALGHEVNDWTMPFDGVEFTDQFLLLWSAGAAGLVDQARTAHPGADVATLVEPWTLGLAQEFISRRERFPGAVSYLKAFERTYHDMFDGFDVILTPTVSTLPPEIGEQAPTREYDALRESVVDFAAFTAPMNVAGAPSMSVPVQWSEGGLPIGSMFSARRGDDGMLLALAYELEATKPWIGRKPPLLA